MLHDPAIHADPETFRPERYLGEPDERQRSTWVFGAGRRKCMGEEYSMQGLMAVLAKAIWALDMWVPAGTDLSLEAAWEGGFMMKPRDDLELRFEVREGRAEGIRKDSERWEREMKELLDGE